MQFETATAPLQHKFKLMLLSVITLTSLAAAGCSLRAPAAPTTPFLSYGDQLHPWYDHAPWDAVWSSNPGHIMVRSDSVRKIYVAPVDTTYLNKTQDKSGNWVATRTVAAEDIQAITDLIRKDFIEAIKSHPQTNLQLQDAPTSGTLILQLSLVELVPTRIGINGVADVGGLIVPGSKAIEEAAGVGVQAAGGEIASGTIAIEMKLTAGVGGAVLAEMKDRENDPASILPNYRDFEQYGWSRRTISDWAEQFADVFGTSASDKVSNSADVSLLPW